jgi:hypothetical protein
MIRQGPRDMAKTKSDLLERAVNAAIAEARRHGASETDIKLLVDQLRRTAKDNSEGTDGDSLPVPDDPPKDAA